MGLKKIWGGVRRVYVGNAETPLGDWTDTEGIGCITTPIQTVPSGKRWLFKNIWVPYIYFSSARYTSSSYGFTYSAFLVINNIEFQIKAPTTVQIFSSSYAPAMLDPGINIAYTIVLEEGDSIAFRWKQKSYNPTNYPIYLNANSYVDLAVWLSGYEEG